MLRFNQRVFSLFTIVFLLFSVSAIAQMPDPELGECDMAYPGGGEEVQKSLRAILNDDLTMAKIYANNALNENDKDAHAFYLLGEIGLRSRNIRAAEAYFTQCLDVCPDYKAEVKFILGQILMANNKKEKGKALLEDYLKDESREGIYDDEAEFLLKEARIIEELLANPVPYNPQIVRPLSTNVDEFLAITSPDGQYCFFTRREMRRPRHAGPGDRAVMVEEFSVATQTATGYTKGEAMPSPFNDGYNQGASTITADNRYMVFTICTGQRECDLFYTQKEGDFWGPVQSIGDNVNIPETWESQPSISPNGDRLYFTSDRDGGQGGLDIYVCRRKPDGTWTDPQNLGPTINTPLHDKSPFIHSDSRTLYFASQGHIGLGGYDIFYTQQDASLNFEEPINIGYPINNEKDQLGMFVTLDGSKAYFNSKEMRGPGGWDLYSFELHQAARPMEVAMVRGRLTDENNQVAVDAEVTIKNLATREIKRIDVDNTTGEYTAVVALADNEDVMIMVEDENAAFSTKFVNKETTQSGIIEGDLEVAPLRVGREYRLNDINFPTNSYRLDNNSMLIIEEFALYLEDHPSVKVDIQGHTDNVGDGQDNLVLSQNRARVVYEYLLDLGISASRMTHHGFGENKPVAPNADESGRAKNRRTIFVITSL